MQTNVYIKRFMLICLTACLLLSLFACGGKKQPSNEGGEISTEQSVSTDESDINVGDESSVEIEYTSEALFETAPYQDGVAITNYIGEGGVIAIPESIYGSAVLAINTGAFKDIKKSETENERIISEVIVPSSVQLIAHGAFTGCKKIESLSVPFAGGAADAHTYIGYIFGAQNPQGNEKAMPESLVNLTVGGKAIHDNAFYGCENVKSISLTEAETVGTSAFENCTALKTLLIPISATTVGANAMRGCTSLTTLSLPYLGNGEDKLFLGATFGATDYTENLDYVPSSLRTLTVNVPEELPVGAFYECKGLVTLNLVGNLKTVNEKTFYRCRRLKYLNIECDDYTGISSIAPYSFAYCAALGEITLDEGVNEIPEGTFYSCSALRTINVGDKVNELPAAHRDIGAFAFAYCESLPSFTLPHGMTEIKEKMFYGCSSLVEITVPASVTAIGKDAFMGCSTLKSLSLQAGVETVAEGAFSYCYSLRSLELPASVASIGDRAFAYSGIKELSVKGSNVSVGDKVFEGCEGFVIDVKAGSDTYNNFVAAGVGNSNFKN